MAYPEISMDEKLEQIEKNQTVAKCDFPECEKEFRNINPKYAAAALRSHKAVHLPKRPGSKLPKKEIESLVNTRSARLRSGTGSETLTEKVARLRKERVPIGMPEKKWSCPLDDGYHYRVFNDNWMSRPANIQKAKAAGYEFVTSDNDKEKPQIVGTNDNGTPIKGFLMRIPKEIFDEDQSAKQKPVDAVDEQIRKGSFQQGAGDNRYIPTTGIKIESNHRPPG